MQQILLFCTINVGQFRGHVIIDYQIKSSYIVVRFSVTAKLTFVSDTYTRPVNET